jgi:transmembrane sensor
MERRISDQTADEAGYWDARLRSPHCTEADRTLFSQWRDACPAHREAFERLQAIHANLRHHLARADVRSLCDEARRAKNLRAPRRHIFAAAALIAGLAAIATTFWATLPGGSRHASVSELMAMAETLIGSHEDGVYETGAGQRLTDTLQDGSSVELNARTRIKVVFSENTRNVELIYGQAFFHVAHDPRRPFVVRAADREITAVGTQFDVRLDALSVRVTLIEGNVKVSTDYSGSTSQAGAAHSAFSLASSLRAPKPGASRDHDTPPVDPSNTNTIYLTPGQQFVAHLPGTPRKGPDSSELGASREDALVRTIDIGKVTGWRDGRIYLEDLPLTDAAAEMNRHSPVQISVDDPQIAQLRVNGMFRAGEQEAFVTALKQYFPIDARYHGDTEIILTRRR